MRIKSLVVALLSAALLVAVPYSSEARKFKPKPPRQQRDLWRYGGGYYGGARYYAPPPRLYIPYQGVGPSADWVEYNRIDRSEYYSRNPYYFTIRRGWY